MKLCLLTPTFLPRIGGAEICIDQLACHLQQQGHPTVVLSQHTSPATNPSTEPLLADKPYTVHHYPRPWSQQGLYLRPRRTLRRLHEHYGFDLVNAHMAYPSAFIAEPLRTKHRVPTVITVHGGTIFHRSRFRHRPAIWKRIAHSLATADAVISLSSYSTRLIKEIAPQQDHIASLGNGVDLARFAHTRYPLPETLAERCGKAYVLGLGRLVPGKGFHTMIEAFARARSQLPASLRLVFAGDGPERQRLEQLARQHDIQNRVVFLGTILGDDKIALLQHCLFTVLPSSREDNMPLVLLESMACGKPILASHIGGIPDMVHDNRTGRLCPAEDSDAFATGLVHLSEANAAASMASACLELAGEHDWQTIAERYLSLFQELVPTTR